MLKTPELAMPRSHTVTTLCNGRREVWTDYEETKAYYLELMMSTDGQERDRAECVYIQLMHGLDECMDEDQYTKRSVAVSAMLLFRSILYFEYIRAKRLLLNMPIVN